MDEATRHKLIWGWLRLFLGIAQMFFAAAGAFALLSIGLHPITYICLSIATIATITSCLLYQGRADPSLPHTQSDGSSTPRIKPGNKKASKGH